MKTLIKTSMIVLALAGIMAIMAGSAMAAPMDKVILDQDIMAVDRPGIIDASDMALVPIDQGDQPVFPDGGDDECAGCDDEQVPDDGDEGVEEEDDDGLDDGGDEGVVDEEQTPPVDENDDTDEEETPPATSDSGKRLPNTGTQLAVIGGIGLLAALTAFGARKALKKRMR